LTPNDHCSGRTAPLTSKLFILYIYSTNIGTEYFKHFIYSSFFSLQNAVYFIILTYLVPVLFTFYVQGALKLKNNNSGAKRLIDWRENTVRSHETTLISANTAHVYFNPKCAFT
jgi:predicted membrane protein